MSAQLGFLIAGDWHFRGSNPRARTDDFKGALTAKVREVFGLAREGYAAGIIVAGDITDSPGLAYSTLGDLAALLREAPCRVYAVAGNHDMYGANPETLPRSAFGLLERVGLIHRLDLSTCRDAEVNGLGRVILYGHDYDAETDRGPGAYLVPEGAPAEAFSILVAHGMLLQEPPGFDLRHTLLRDVAASPRCPDVLVVGHEHLGFGVRRLEAANQRGELLAINPGALARLTAHPAEIERAVQVCRLTIGYGGAEAELISVKCARPGHEVLSREHLEAAAAREEQLSKFLALLTSEGEATFLEVQQIIDDIARREGLPAEVVAEALRRIGAAREQMGGEAA